MPDGIESKESQLQESQVQDLKHNEMAEKEALNWIENLEQVAMSRWQAPSLPSAAVANSIKKLLSDDFERFLSLVKNIFSIIDKEWKKSFFSLMGEKFLLSLRNCTGQQFSGVLREISDPASKIDIILQLDEKDVLGIIDDQGSLLRIFYHLKLADSKIDEDMVVKLNAIKDKALDKVFLKSAPARYEDIVKVLSNSHIDPREKYCFLLCLLENYERKLISRKDSFLGGIFGYHKQGKLSGVHLLKRVLNNENGEAIPNGGVWSDGKLGEIASAYRSYTKK